MARPFSLVLLGLMLAGPAMARPAPPTAPTPAPPEPTLDWPWPEPDPKSWWDDKRPAPAEAADPLGGRKGGRGSPAYGVAGIPDVLLYRLWGLPPLQHESLRGGEMVVEVWVRPSLSVRQTVARVTLRQDGRAFIQARAGLACCAPQIERRVGFDAEAPAAAAARVAALRNDPLWSAPRDVRVAEGGGAKDAVCANGSSFDLILLTAERARIVRRACDPAEVGQAAEVLEAVLGQALGHEPRIDVLFRGGADFAAERAAYRELLAGGGALKAADTARSPAAPAPEEPQS